MKRIPKGFIGEGNGNMINVDCIVNVEKSNGKIIATDKYNIKHYVSENQLYKLQRKEEE